MQHLGSLILAVAQAERQVQGPGVDGRPYASLLLEWPCRLCRVANCISGDDHFNAPVLLTPFWRIVRRDWLSLTEAARLNCICRNTLLDQVIAHRASAFF